MLSTTREEPRLRTLVWGFTLGTVVTGGIFVTAGLGALGVLLMAIASVLPHSMLTPTPLGDAVSKTLFVLSIALAVFHFAAWFTSLAVAGFYSSLAVSVVATWLTYVSEQDEYTTSGFHVQSIIDNREQFTAYVGTDPVLYDKDAEYYFKDEDEDDEHGAPSMSTAALLKIMMHSPDTDLLPSK